MDYMVHSPLQPLPRSHLNDVQQSQKDGLLLRVHGLHVCSAGSTTVPAALLLGDVSFTVSAGTRLLVTGASGCGKTTLFRLISGLLPGSTGDAVQFLTDKALFIPQAPYCFPGSLVDNVLYPSRVAEGAAAAEATLDTVRHILEQLGLAYLYERYSSDPADLPAVLSPGEMQRLCIARVLYHAPDIVCNHTYCLYIQ